jgi:superfamily II DNA or RNA helicase
MEDHTRLEFHRAGIGLVPSSGEDLGQAIYIASLPDTERPHFSCSCGESGLRTCTHLQELDRHIRSIDASSPGSAWSDRFTRSLWNRLAGHCADEDPVPSLGVRVFDVDDGVAIVDRRGRELARWYDDSPARARFLERLGRVPEERSFADRAAILARLNRLQLTPQERQLEREGAKSSRQSREESFWFRLAYHCARELGEEGLAFRPAVNRDTGAFTFTCHAGGRPVVRFSVPADAVKPVLRLLTREYPDPEGEGEDNAVSPIPLRTLFHVGPGTQVDGDPKVVRPAIVTLKRFGERRYLEREETQRFRYGRLQYVPELEVLTELEEPGKERKFKTPQRLRTERSRVPSFADDTPEKAASEVSPDELAGTALKIFRGFDRIEIRAEKVTVDSPDGGNGHRSTNGDGDVDEDEADDRSWYWLSVHYGAGSARVSLTDLLRARKEGLPYLEVSDGWIDLSSEAVNAVEAVFDDRDPSGPLGHPAAGDRFQLGLPDLLRLHASSDQPLPMQVDADGDARELLDRMVQLRPGQPYRPPKLLTSKLRDYQVYGTNWLRFLAENALGGLLCDDMGLGKTHQAMALMASLTEQDGVHGPFLVVCPTTVLPHWKAKLRDHAPGLRVAIHHGPQRDLDESLRRGDIILTSYGILRNDSIELASVPFAAVIFDEIQHLKNRDTVSYRAAGGLDAHVRLGLTGTPVENTLTELKALFDLVLPGYLGSDARFVKRYGETGEGEDGGDGMEDRATRLEELRRIISPFILRRTKAAVLDELPEKIEDLRLCALSEDQIGLYREAVEGPGAAEIVGRLQSGTDPVPYIHVFALLNVLKRICDHPALALDELENAGNYRSGKWDLFKELLDEALDNGQKVVVFTQYLGMVDLIAWHLEELGVGYVTLTGSSRNRGDLVDRFNQEPDCRVFVGSLKAGGTGIDLIGGSVVIHYDRWWNSAREDQATDRVHRMGQRRAVQVFKLVTEGTLEEKIHSIIERKRRLADAVIQEDDPKLSKLFTREEILDLLRPVDDAS